MKAHALALILIAFTAAASAAGTAHIIVTDPVQVTIGEGGIVDLGVVGPGQRIEIEISTASGYADFRGIEEYWDRMYVLPESLPRGWTSQDSLFYERKMKAFVIVPKDAYDGEYGFSLQAVEEYTGPQPLSFRAKVKVTRDVLKFDVLQDSVGSGVDQPAVYTLQLSNTGSASDAFEIEVTKGLPAAWTFKKRVFVPHNSVKRMQYEVIAADQGEFTVTFNALSISSDLIRGTDTAELVARSSLWEDMKAASRGVLLFPSIEQAVYSLIGLIASNSG
ncbi:MAG: hypothetical protein V1787_02905 [Candidatus Micrarchaeota archaeon]